MRHKEIKQNLLEEGKKRGISSDGVKVLSIDPYFVGSEMDYRNAQWASDLWDKMMASRKKPLHLRGFHYWVQSQGILKPGSKEKYAHGADPNKDWKFLTRSSQVARYLGIGSWRGLLDLKHPDPIDFDSYWVGSGLAKTGQVDIQTSLNEKLEGLVDDFIRGLLWEAPKYHDKGYQMYHMEIWCEKNSMGFVLEPACRKYDACYQPLVGQSSVEKVTMAADRAIKAIKAGKKVRLFYIADWDRYGWTMVTAVARKLEFMLHQHGITDADVKLMRLALNDDQVAKYKLPKAPKHGEAVVELDALEAIHPGALGDIVEKALRPYYDRERPKVVEEENKRVREVVRQLLEEKLRVPLQDAFQNVDLASIAGDVRLDSAIDPDFEPPTPEHEIDDSGTAWMFDASRSYWEQLEEYKRYKCDRVEEEA